MADLDPAVVEQILAMQSREDDPQAISLSRKQQLVNALRSQALSPNTGQMVGRTYVGAGIPGALQTVAQGYFAGKGQQSIDQGEQALGAQRTSGRQAYFKALMNAMRRPNIPGGGMMGPQMDAPSEDISLGY